MERTFAAICARGFLSQSLDYRFGYWPTKTTAIRSISNVCGDAQILRTLFSVRNRGCARVYRYLPRIYHLHCVFECAELRNVSLVCAVVPLPHVTGTDTWMTHKDS